MAVFEILVLATACFELASRVIELLLAIKETLQIRKDKER